MQVAHTTGVSAITNSSLDMILTTSPHVLRCFWRLFYTIPFGQWIFRGVACQAIEEAEWKHH
jgi:hypothetical protein